MINALKLKVWNKKSKEMLTVNKIEYPTFEAERLQGLGDDDYTFLYFTDGSFVNVKNAAVRRFTGLQDKNGNDIYEGDIVKTPTDKPMVISWSKKFASFVIDRDGWMFSHWFGESCNGEDVEIIGNIYQNEDLLTTGGEGVKN